MPGWREVEAALKGVREQGFRHTYVHMYTRATSVSRFLTLAARDAYACICFRDRIRKDGVTINTWGTRAVYARARACICIYVCVGMRADQSNANTHVRLA